MPVAPKAFLDDANLLSIRPLPASTLVDNRKNLNLRSELRHRHKVRVLPDLSKPRQTAHAGGLPINTDIEKFFFGPADREGTFALDHFETFELNSSSDAAFNALVPYMSLQKLRTPKGLAFLRAHIGAHNNNDLLLLLQKIRNIYCTIWSEAVWQIADAKLSPTKFIVSDHPVTVYNRECFPDSHHCGAESDPDITSVGTHTLFPLSMNKVLIITNLSWVRDPYQNPLAVRPNPELFRRPGLFSFLNIQFDRFLSEEEVIEINHVIKRRAYRYIAASEEDWLYPERQLKSDHWRKLGNGYLFMPDPRHVVNGGEVLVSYKSGHVESFSEYGHRPWQTDFKDKQRDDREWQSLHRFQAEWAAMIGPKYRGLSRSFGQWDSPRLEESAEHHQHLVNSDLEFRKRAGERARRRHLRR